MSTLTKAEFNSIFAAAIKNVAIKDVESMINQMQKNLQALQNKTDPIAFQEELFGMICTLQAYSIKSSVLVTMDILEKAEIIQLTN